MTAQELSGVLVEGLSAARRGAQGITLPKPTPKGKQPVVVDLSFYRKKPGADEFPGASAHG